MVHTLTDQSRSNHKSVHHLISIPLGIYQPHRHELFHTLNKTQTTYTQTNHNSRGGDNIQGNVILLN